MFLPTSAGLICITVCKRCSAASRLFNRRQQITIFDNKSIGTFPPISILDTK